jgi:Reversibly glycosylated polypeptide
MAHTAITTTTIFPLDFLEAYADNLLRFGRERDVTIYVAGDRKSPPGCEEQAAACRARGVDARFLSIDEQHDFMRRWPDLAALIPENTDNRRNVAYLAALADGADVVISIDDDNYCLDDVDFVGGHSRAGMECEAPEATGADGWFNLCRFLEAEPSPANLYPRGFPYGRRREGTDTIEAPARGRVGVNVGLWLLDPDTDAIGRLQDRPHVTGWTGGAALLGNRVRCPINTQNTALTRDAMAVYYYVRMGARLRGLVLDRYGDILSGYFLQVCAEAVGDRIRIGDPIVEHRRHAHDLLVDLYHELAGIMVMEELADLFSTVRLPGDSYLTAYRALSHELESFVDARDGFIWSVETRTYFHEVAAAMRVWADVVASLGLR